MSKLHSVEGPLRGKVFDLRSGATIGRDSKCHVRLEGRHISRVHARIEKRNEDLYIRDNGSRNGIYINGRRVDESILRPDDEVEIGEHLLVFDPTKEPDQVRRQTTTVLESVVTPFTLEDTDERYAKIPGIASKLVGLDKEKEIARGLLDELMKEVSAERGFIMLVDASGNLRPAARKVPARDEEFYLSNVVSYQVKKERRAVIAVDVLRREPNAGKRVGVLCAPLSGPTSVSGLAYLETSVGEGQNRPDFTKADLRFAAALCALVGIRIEQIYRIPGSARIGERSLPQLAEAYVKEVVVEALRRAKGDIAGAAKLLDIDRADLDRKLVDLGIDSEPKTDVQWKSVET